MFFASPRFDAKEKIFIISSNPSSKARKQISFAKRQGLKLFDFCLW